MDEQETILVAIHTDGIGTFQPRCMDCDWTGEWFRKEEKAVEQAKKHMH